MTLYVGQLQAKYAFNIIVVQPNSRKRWEGEKKRKERKVDPIVGELEPGAVSDYRGLGE